MESAFRRSERVRGGVEDDKESVEDGWEDEVDDSDARSVRTWSSK